MSRETEGGNDGGGYWGLTARRCDSCKSSPALVFCSADAAFLCSGCDSRVHSAPGRLRHERVWVCEVCEQAPAAVTCKADAAALCVACDADIHSANPLARRHERVPVVPFLDPVAAAARPSADGGGALFKTPEGVDADEERSEVEAASWLLPDPNSVAAKGLIEAPEFKPPPVDYLFTDVDPYLDLDYASSIDGRFVSHADSIVPVQAKSAAAAVHLPPTPFMPEGVIELDFRKPSFSSYSHSVSSSEVGVVPDGRSGGAMTDVTNPYGGGGGGGGRAVAMMDREARVMRYREKRKNRRFDKTIRYASRKAYAETRPRIKGRFAKRAEMEEEVDGIYGSAAAALMMDSGYGVVPSF